MCRRRVSSLVALLFLSVAPGAYGQEDSDALVLSPEVLTILSELQEGWLDWLSGVNRDDESAASAALASLLANTREIGMTRLPELSRGASARAVLFAAEGDFLHAELALEAAEQLDPGRPEIAFSSARVHRLQGDQKAMVVQYLVGMRRLYQQPLDGALLLANLQIWALGAISILVFCGIALLMATRGQGMVADLSGALGKFMPATIAYPLAFAFLLWPLLLPAGMFWIAIFFSILLFSYVDPPERILLLGLCSVLVITPWLVNRQRARVSVELAPEFVAAEEIAQGSIEGTFALDLERLRSQLPDSIAVNHLLADLYSRLGQWKRAQELYLLVLESEPENMPAVLDLGVSEYHQAKYEEAIESFRRAAKAPKPSGLASFNLSQAYSELYQFDLAREALRIAQEIDVKGVADWIQLAAVDRVVRLEGGMARTREIRADLAASKRVRQPVVLPTGAWRGVLLAAVPVFLLGIAAPQVLRRLTTSRTRSAESNSRGGLGLWVPGIEEVVDGQWAGALVALLLPAALLSLPGAVQVGFVLPSGPRLDPNTVWVVAGLGLVAYLLLRLLVRAWSYR